MPRSIRLAIDLAKSVAPPTVLVMTDDLDWRAVVQRVLEHEGFKVLTARHPGHALVTCARHDGPVHVLLSDGEQGRRRSDFPPRIFKDRPGITLLHLESRPHSRDELLAAVVGALAA